MANHSWFPKGILQGITAHVTLQLGVAAMITAAIVWFFHWLVGLSIEWLLILGFIGIASITVVVNQISAFLVRWHDRKEHLKFIMNPVTFGQNSPPNGLLQLFKTSDVDPWLKHYLEIEQQIKEQQPYKFFPPTGDGLCLFMLYRVGIKNRTNTTILRVKIDLSEIKNVKHGYLPTPIRLMNSQSGEIDLTPDETAFFDFVSVPVLPESEWKKRRQPGVSEMMLHFSNAEYPNRMRADSYEFLLSARGDSINPRSAWFRLKMEDSGSFDFRMIERS